MTINYTPTGICARQITVELNDGIINKVEFLGGCPGNLLGISKLVEGRKPEDVVKELKGVCCGGKPTSCPDQLTLALEAALASS